MTRETNSVRSMDQYPIFSQSLNNELMRLDRKMFSFFPSFFLLRRYWRKGPQRKGKEEGMEQNCENWRIGNNMKRKRRKVIWLECARLCLWMLCKYVCVCVCTRKCALLLIILIIFSDFFASPAQYYCYYYYYYRMGNVGWRHEGLVCSCSDVSSCQRLFLRLSIFTGACASFVTSPVHNIFEHEWASLVGKVILSIFIITLLCIDICITSSSSYPIYILNWLSINSGFLSIGEKSRTCSWIRPSISVLLPVCELKPEPVCFHPVYYVCIILFQDEILLSIKSQFWKKSLPAKIESFHIHI